MEENTTGQTHRYCKNCSEKLSKRGKFCPSCGQRDFDGRVRMRDLLSKFLSSLTHLDNKFLNMARRSLIPGQVSVDYFQGKIKRYPHPLQFFFIVMFFFLLLFSKQFDNATLNLFGGSLNFSSEVTYKAGSAAVSKSNLYEALKRCMIAREYRQAFDSLPPDWKTAQVKLAHDSVDLMVNGPWEYATTMLLETLSDTADQTDPLISNLDTINLNIGFSKVAVSTLDFALLDADSIIQKYQFNTWGEQTTLKQGMKALRDQQGFLNQYVGSFGWAVLVLVTLMALVLKLLFRKNHSYYVEHFIFLLHQQSGSFLMLTLALVVHEYLIPLTWFWIPVLVWFFINIIPAVKRFYGNSWGWTLLKSLVFIIVYITGLVALFIATLLIVFAIF